MPLLCLWDIYFLWGVEVFEIPHDKAASQFVTTYWSFNESLTLSVSGSCLVRLVLDITTSFVRALLFFGFLYLLFFLLLTERWLFVFVF